MKSNYVFTVNDNARAWAEALMEYTYNNEKQGIRYICGQLEVAPETGNLHFQGYIQLSRTQRMSWLKNHVHATAHFEAQKAPSNDQAREYCMKEETRAPDSEFIELGIYKKGRIGRGARNDLTKIKEAVKAGMTQKELADNHLNEYAKYYRFFDKMRGLYRPQAHPEGVEVILHYGEPGTGKTRLAEEENPGVFVTPINNGTLWIDGYDGQETVLLDDFAGSLSKYALTNTLRLLDRYPIQVPVKGSFVWWQPKKIIVTTNIHPFRWYDWTNRQNQYQALWRRFTKVIYFPLNSEPEEQHLETFFYDNDLIWPSPEELFRPLPVCENVWDYPSENREQHHST